MINSSINNLFLEPSSQKEVLQNKYRRIHKTATTIRREISKLHLAISYAENDLRNAQGAQSSFMSQYEIELHFARRYYEDYTRYAAQPLTSSVSYPEQTLFSWEPTEPTAEQLESLSFISQIEEISEESEDGISLSDSSYTLLSEEGLRSCICKITKRITSLNNERQTCIEKLARTRFLAKDLRNKVRIYTPEQDRIIGIGQQLLQMSNQAFLSPKPRNSSQKNNMSSGNPICNLINKICSFIKRCFQFIFCYSSQSGNSENSTNTRVNASQNEHGIKINEGCR